MADGARVSPKKAPAGGQAPACGETGVLPTQEGLAAAPRVLQSRGRVLKCAGSWRSALNCPGGAQDAPPFASRALDWRRIPGSGVDLSRMRWGAFLTIIVASVSAMPM